MQGWRALLCHLVALGSGVMGNRAFIFPGQGVQRVGMGADVAEHSAAAKRVYSTADAILGMELTTLSFEGPADTLTETCNAQPAIFTASAACLAAYLEACGAETVSGLPDALQPALVAGHSIGELTALYAAEALTLEDGLRLVQARGELMQRAVADSPGGMAAVIGVSPQVVMQLCARARSTDSAGVVSIATFNTPQQVVIAGDNSALDRAVTLLKEHGARRVIPLKVSGAFHTDAMAFVQEEWKAVVEAATIMPPKIPIVANATANIVTTVDELRHELTVQLTSPVRWAATIDILLRRNLGPVLEFGPGAVLTRMIGSVATGTTAVAVDSQQAVWRVTEAGQVA